MKTGFPRPQRMSPWFWFLIGTLVGFGLLRVGIRQGVSVELDRVMAAHQQRLQEAAALAVARVERAASLMEQAAAKALPGPERRKWTTPRWGHLDARKKESSPP